MRVLVVDDEEHLRRVMRLTLEAEGYEVAEAPDGEEALRLFGDGSSLDATLLDQKMPGLDGLETLRRMKQRRGDACVIMVTAYATIELAIDAMKLGATDFVRKPMTPDTLRHAVAAALLKRETAVADAAAPLGRAPSPVPPPLSPPEVWTTNGFFVRGVEATSSPEGQRSSEHHFVVRRGRDAAGAEVVVSIDPGAVLKIARDCGKDVSRSASFWHRLAETALVEYLWSEAALPEGGRLVVARLSASMLYEAMHWSGD
jgi:DNA-binding response OmpR family regulator